MTQTQKWARIVDGVVWETSDEDPTGKYDSSLVWVSCPITTKCHDIYDAVTGEFASVDPVVIGDPVEPVEPAPPPVAMKTKLSRVEFKMQFTQPERLAIKMARAYAGTDPAQIGLKMALDDFYELLEDPGLTEVDLTHPEVVGGVNGLVAATLLTSERATAILAGIPQ